MAAKATLTTKGNSVTNSESTTVIAVNDLCSTSNFRARPTNGRALIFGGLPPVTFGAEGTPVEGDRRGLDIIPVHVTEDLKCYAQQRRRAGIVAYTGQCGNRTEAGLLKGSSRTNRKSEGTIELLFHPSAFRPYPCSSAVPPDVNAIAVGVALPSVANILTGISRYFG